MSVHSVIIILGTQGIIVRLDDQATPVAITNICIRLLLIFQLADANNNLAFFWKLLSLPADADVLAAIAIVYIPEFCCTSITEVPAKSET